MKPQIILTGSGGCMRELAWQMPDWQISGYVDVTPPEHPIKVGDRIIPYLGKDDFLLQQTKDINVAIAEIPRFDKRLHRNYKRIPTFISRTSFSTEQRSVRM